MNRLPQLLAAVGLLVAAILMLINLGTIVRDPGAFVDARILFPIIESWWNEEAGLYPSTVEAQREPGVAEQQRRWIRREIDSRDAATQQRLERDRRLAEWAQAPSARLCHPREEHLLPLMVCAGAAADERGTTPFREPVVNLHTLAAHFG